MMNCDQLDLSLLLEADDEHTCLEPTSEVVEHIDTCAHCQNRLTRLAAAETQWRSAQAWLNEEPNSRCRGTTWWRHPTWWNKNMDFQQSLEQKHLSAPKHPEMLGRLGRYDIERVIGSGGMGVVYKAHDTELNRPVAIKLLAPYLAESGAARQRFAREGRAAAAVVDEHVVPIYNVDSDEESPFLVMRYVAGGSLQQRLDREGALALEEILRIGIQLAKGLAAAHAQGLIHRDVKPSNVLLDEGVERALLTDFGLARAEDDACLTRSGFHPGTPHYMSPEQVRGEELDARSDLFGLGCVLYALCTGRPPFRAETSFAILRRITDDPPRSIREINPAIPEWLEQIVMRLLAKSPMDRFDSAEAIATLLEACLLHVRHPKNSPLPPSLTSVPQQRSKKRITLWKKIGLAALVVSFAVLAGVLIALEWNKGTLTIESDRSDIPIRIMQSDREYLTMQVDAGSKSIRIAAGQYHIEIEGGSEQFTIEGSVVTIARGDEQVVRITHRTHPDTGTPEALSTSSDLNPPLEPPQFSLDETVAKPLVILPDQRIVERGISATPLLEAAWDLLNSTSTLAESRSLRVPQPNTTLEFSPPRELVVQVGATSQQFKIARIIIASGSVWGPTTILAQTEEGYRQFADYSVRNWLRFQSELARLSSADDAATDNRTRSKTRFSFTNAHGPELVTFLKKILPECMQLQISLNPNASELLVEAPQSQFTLVRDVVTNLGEAPGLPQTLQDVKIEIAGETQQQLSQLEVDYSQQLAGQWNLLSTQWNGKSESFEQGAMVATIKNQALTLRSPHDKSRTEQKQIRVLSNELIEVFMESDGETVSSLGRYRLVGDWLWIAIQVEPVGIDHEPPADAIPSAPERGVNYMMFHRAAPKKTVGSRTLNIGFAYDPGQGSYDAAVGSPNDIWNFVDLGTTAVDFMRYADGAGSSTRLRITPFDGEWAVETKNQIFRGYIYHNCQCVDLEATLLDVPPGSYRLYVYAHGNSPDQNASVEVLIGERSLGRKATGKESSSEYQSSRLMPGIHYVVFELEVTTSQPVRIISHRDGSNYSMFNAIQLLPVLSDSYHSHQDIPQSELPDR